MARKKHHGISDQRKASIHRLEDARALFEKERWRGCMYLAGYAVECRLKYKLMVIRRCQSLEALEIELAKANIKQSPFSHSLRLLLSLSGGLERLKQNHPVWEVFSGVLNPWEPAWRYNPDLADRDAAEEFLEAAQILIEWIDNNL